MNQRRIIQIDEEKCNGCGLCVPACAEGAIRIVDGKARLVGDAYCDGLGACLGHCPQGAITIIEREAALWDAVAVAGAVSAEDQAPAAQSPSLGHWPIQLHLVAAGTAFLQNADLVLAADCVGFALADFQRRLLRGRPLLIGCPKLDDAPAYVKKLAAIATLSSINSLTVVHMAVPCCAGLVRIAREALRIAGKAIPLEEITVSIRGEIVDCDP